MLFPSPTSPRRNRRVPRPVHFCTPSVFRPPGPRAKGPRRPAQASHCTEKTAVQAPSVVANVTGLTGAPLHSRRRLRNRCQWREQRNLYVRNCLFPKVPPTRPSKPSTSRRKGVPARGESRDQTESVCRHLQLFNHYEHFVQKRVLRRLSQQSVRSSAVPGHLVKVSLPASCRRDPLYGKVLSP